MSATETNKTPAAPKGDFFFRESVRSLVTSPRWERAIVTLIVINAITLGLETSATVMQLAGSIINTLDTIILAIFVVEIALRLYAHGLSFWREGWNVFDFAVVAIALLPNTGNFSVLRSLRIIRAFRLISAVKSVRRVVNGLINALPGMGAVIMLLLIVYYVFAVMATKLYADVTPEYFGTLGLSAFSLFKVMTLEGWPEIADAVIEKERSAYLFFIVYILVTSFAVLNLFIGIIVDAMQKEQEELLQEDREREEAEFKVVVNELRELRREVAQLKQSLDKHGGAR